MTVKMAKVGLRFLHRPMGNNPPVDPAEQYIYSPGAYFEVAERCEAITDAGFWMCITCNKVFGNNRTKDAHVAHIEGNEIHVLCWVCGIFGHGPEARELIAPP